MPFASLKSGVLVALIAHSLIGTSLVWDKVLLRKPETKNLVNYVFWLGAISIFGLALIPFGFKMPRMSIALLGFATGALHLIAVYFYYDALKRGEASESLAAIGGFSPVATAIIGLFLLHQPFAGGQVLAFVLLTTGGFLMFFSELMDVGKMIVSVALSSVLFGLVNVLQRIVFRETNFVSGYVFFTLGTCAAAGLLLVPKQWRRQIVRHSERANPRSRFWYFVNRFVDGVGSFLTFYAISLTHPAIVDAISGVRFAIIFVGALLLTKLRPDWLREDFTGRTFVIKTLATASIMAGLVWLSIHGGSEETGAATARERQIPFNIALSCNLVR
ncbi:MAG TPA: DMT family transporter [Terriglobales bacterium]|nr:DMT family transporter [Terriglobales bacterium]